MARVSSAIWAGVGIVSFAVVGGTAWVGWQLLRAWRELKRLPGAMLAQIAELNEGLSVLERRVGGVERDVAELQSSVERVTISLARARVLMGAVSEVRSAVASARSLLPSK